MHGACTNRPYFHFWSKIWCHHCVPRPRFPLRCRNFGDSRTFRADMGLLNICMGFQDLDLKWGYWGQNRGRGGAIFTPNELVLTLRGFYVCANFGENRSRNVTMRVLLSWTGGWLQEMAAVTISVLWAADIVFTRIVAWCHLTCHCAAVTATVQ